ncbi:Putative cytosolic protein [Borrelia coriaceae ATCC 43381]|uniref:Cytosolic protein n=1 Tax=Borrelia coriaceae ATCC 43381 TaxID=1408429 RepID=W5STV0_9SPIR|nr:Putative cytosolic protein [Borrelia coriaceae ATCC 43381]
MECALVKAKSILEQGEDLINILMSLIWQFKKIFKGKNGL